MLNSARSFPGPMGLCFLFSFPKSAKSLFNEYVVQNIQAALFVCETVKAAITCSLIKLFYFPIHQLMTRDKILGPNEKFYCCCHCSCQLVQMSPSDFSGIMRACRSILRNYVQQQWQSCIRNAHEVFKSNS